ncbi:restriction endonuclease [Delftia sp. BR1]|nr:restriction endonuclease [Delftia sp. BR1]
MPFDRITFCLERLTDYREFERLCSALLAGAGYPNIDPLGGTGDGGRDAIVRQDASGRTIGFAYTVREDWRVKLKSDCASLAKNHYKLDALVYVCTEALNASQKDWAYELVRDDFGWELELFDLERLRALLAGPHRHLIAQHPSIFTPPFFPQKGGQSMVESRDLVVIDHVDADHALATWLARRLALAGYCSWCRGMAPLVGENADETVRALLEFRAAQYIPILSPAALQDPSLLERCIIAATRDRFVAPCTVALPPTATLPSKLSAVVAAEFGSSWMTGLGGVLGRLKAQGVEIRFDFVRGRSIALGGYLPDRVTVAEPEPVFSNVFPLTLPDVMKTFELRYAPKEEELEEWRKSWPCARLGDRLFAAFQKPPDEVKVAGNGGVLWKDVFEKEGRRTRDIAKELARRSLEVVCIQKGLKYCPDRKLFYYPDRDAGPWVQALRHVDGRNTTVQLTGERTKGFGERASLFLYQLAPRFSAQCDAQGNWTVLVNVYVRVTDLEGKVFEGKEIGRRRKFVTKQWWNNQWLSRMLGVVQGLETSVGHVQFDEGEAAVVMSTSPLTWQCPIGLDVGVLSGAYDMGEELAEYRTRDEDEDDEVPGPDKDGGLAK